MDFRKRKSMNQTAGRKTITILAHGGSGSGKSRLAALMPAALNILMEAQGRETIRQWCDDKGLLIEAYRDDDDGTYTGTPGGLIDDPKLRLKKVEHILQAVHAGEPTEDGIRIPGYSVDKRSGEAKFSKVTEDCPVISSVCFDSLTEWQEVQLEALIGEKIGAVGEDQVTLPTWGILMKKSKGLIRKLRELPVNVLVLCLTDEVQDGMKTRYVPALYGNKLHPRISRYFTAVAWLVKKQSGEGIEFNAVFEHDTTRAICKGCTGLDAVEKLPADPALGGPVTWLRKIAESRAVDNPVAAEVKLPAKSKVAQEAPQTRRRGR